MALFIKYLTQQQRRRLLCALLIVHALVALFALVCAGINVDTYIALGQEVRARVTFGALMQSRRLLNRAERGFVIMMNMFVCTMTIAIAIGHALLAMRVTYFVCRRQSRTD
jgi:hypothetical protein